MKRRTKLIWLEKFADLFGWVCIIASAAAFYFLLAAIALNSPWARLWWTVFVAVISKWLAMGLMDNKSRVDEQVAGLVADG